MVIGADSIGMVPWTYGYGVVTDPPREGKYMWAHLIFIVRYCSGFGCFGCSRPECYSVFFGIFDLFGNVLSMLWIHFLYTYLNKLKFMLGQD